jgi:hypothetical protein
MLCFLNTDWTDEFCDGGRKIPWESVGSVFERNNGVAENYCDSGFKDNDKCLI